jgi:uncharacterized protein with beta-barrel porin domain
MKLIRRLSLTAITAALTASSIPTGYAQAPSLGTAASFGILAGSTVTNTGPSVINGNVGIYPGTACTGFDISAIPPCSLPAGAGHVNGTIHAADGVAQQAQSDNTTAYNVLASRPITADLTGQNLGNRTLTAGVYGFNTSAQMTGALVLDGQGNPNSVFIFKIGSTLTTASASSILLINGAQGGNVFFQVGSSATLGTGTTFVGDILALASIALQTNATINCGAALAQTGAVTLDNNTINICQTTFTATTTILPSNASDNQRAVAAAIDAFVNNGGTLPPQFLNLLTMLSPAQLAAAFTQLSGEAGTGAAQAGTQAMNSFLSLVTNPFDNNRPFSDNNETRPTPNMPVKAPIFGPTPDPRRWGSWASGYGGQTTAAGDPFGIGSHNRSVSVFGVAAGLDYRVTPFTVLGFALGGGGTRYGLSDGLGGGRSDMFQAAVYATTRFNSAYFSAALAHSWHHVTTDRSVTLLGTDYLSASFSANNIGGRIEGGYRFSLPNMLGVPGQFGLTPYAAGQIQSFHTPSYRETALSGSPVFALAYEARTITTARSELGIWYDWSHRLDYGKTLVLRARAAWAHDTWSDPNITASFLALPGSSFTVTGAVPATDLLLASVSSDMSFGNGYSFGLRFDGEFAEHSQKYAGTGRLRYTW